MPWNSLLSQVSSTERSVAPLYIWSLVLIGVVVLAFLGIALLRRRVTGANLPERHGFTLSDLRRMKDAGDIDEEQFQKMRQSIIGVAQGTRKPE